MESWTGSRVYKLVHDKAKKPSANNVSLGSVRDAPIEPPEEVAVEI